MTKILAILETPSNSGEEIRIVILKGFLMEIKLPSLGEPIQNLRISADKSHLVYSIQNPDGIRLPITLDPNDGSNTSPDILVRLSIEMMSSRPFTLTFAGSDPVQIMESGTTFVTLNSDGTVTK